MLVFRKILRTYLIDGPLVKCDIPQGTIFGPLLFLIYDDDAEFASNVLNPIMFHAEIKTVTQ